VPHSGVEERDTLLKDKVAVIYGPGGIGGAGACELASEGATVFVTGREWSPVELVAKEFLTMGGYAGPSSSALADHRPRIPLWDAEMLCAGSNVLRQFCRGCLTRPTAGSSRTASGSAG
jgi:shikimate 5-dehydrogenase